MEDMKNVHILILAGGSGQRLWPLSTKNNPKHLIPFISQQSLLQQTISRFSSLVSLQKNIWVITNQDQVYKIKDQLSTDTNIIVEPNARNTAPAILFACNKIREINIDATIVVSPSDHFIQNSQQFLHKLSNIITWTKDNNKIATIGISPTFPATGYGYIQAGKQLGQDIYMADKFHEKPEIEKARSYVAQGNMFWNSGIFVGTLSTFLSEFKSNAPELTHNMELFVEKRLSYNDLECVSFDYAVMEKSKNIATALADFEWSDVGNLSTFLSLQQKYKENKTEIISWNGQNNLVSVNKSLAVCMGVSDLCIVETDNVILVVRVDDVEHVKKVLPQIQNKHQQIF